MFNYRVADDRSDCLCGKVFETRFDSEGGKHVSLSAICCANISHYVLKVFTSLTTREFALQMFELSAIGTAISISDGYIDYYFRVLRTFFLARKKIPPLATIYLPFQ